MNIVLITGGPSSEREVSISSSRSILKALRESGHNVKVIDPIYGDKEVSEEMIFSSSITKQSPSIDKLKEIQKSSNRNFLKCFDSKIFDNIKLAFLGVHGKFGEDGKIQTLLELRGINYTGSNIFSSALAMDKDISKIIFNSLGIQTPVWIIISKSQKSNPEKINRKILNSIGYPCVIKPNDEGSTVGLSIVHPDVEDIELKNAIDLAFNYSEKIIAERFITGRELTVPIIGNETFPIIEIKPKGGFYDYEHKYTKGMTEYFCPAQIPAEIEMEVKKKALTAHNALGCEVYSRVDFILDGYNNLYCLEVNTLPGMTETSLVPKSAVAKGMNFNQLIEKLIELSLNKEQT